MLTDVLLSLSYAFNNYSAYKFLFEIFYRMLKGSKGFYSKVFSQLKVSDLENMRGRVWKKLKFIGYILKVFVLFLIFSFFENPDQILSKNQFRRYINLKILLIFPFPRDIIKFNYNFDNIFMKECSNFINFEHWTFSQIFTNTLCALIMWQMW
jgi:hypothetical protein